MALPQHILKVCDVVRLSVVALFEELQQLPQSLTQSLTQTQPSSC